MVCLFLHTARATTPDAGGIVALAKLGDVPQLLLVLDLIYVLK